MHSQESRVRYTNMGGETKPSPQVLDRNSGDIASLTIASAKPINTRQTVSGPNAMPNVSNGNGWRLPAYQIEQLLLKQLAQFLRDHGALLDALGPGQRSPDRVSVLLKHASTLAKLRRGITRRTARRR